MSTTGELPRYLEIQRDLQERIASGDWHPGHRIPSEHELQRTYRCSRMTVNKALSALANAGLIVRRRRSGSAVAAPKSQQSVLEIPDIKAEVAAMGEPYCFEVLSSDKRKANAQDAERLGIAAGAPVLALSVLHRAADAPYAMEERLINLAVVPSASTETFEESPPGTWLLALIPWTDAEHVIRAEAADARLAVLLDIKRNAACLVVERRTWQAGRAVTWARLSYPGERRQLVSRFSPSNGVGREIVW